MSTKYIDIEALSYYNEKVTGKINAVEAKIPTKNSQLTNDSLYITNQVNDLANYYTKSNTYTKGEVDTKISNLIDSAPETLNTLNELAVAIQENDSLIETLDAAIGTKANDNAVVHLTGTETISGDKTFGSANNIHTVTIVDNNQDRPIIFGNNDTTSQSLRIDDTLRYNAGNKTLLTGNIRVTGNISDGTNNITVANIATKSSLKTVATTGSYNDLTDKPTLPDLSIYATKDTTELTNYTTKNALNNLLANKADKSAIPTDYVKSSDISTLQTQVNTAIKGITITRID